MGCQLAPEPLVHAGGIRDIDIRRADKSPRRDLAGPWERSVGADCERERINLEFVCQVQAGQAEPLVLRGIGKLLAGGRAIVTGLIRPRE